jgi:hypothetical protein
MASRASRRKPLWSEDIAEHASVTLHVTEGRALAGIVPTSMGSPRSSGRRFGFAREQRGACAEWNARISSL